MAHNIQGLRLAFMAALAPAKLTQTNLARLFLNIDDYLVNIENKQTRTILSQGFKALLLELNKKIAFSNQTVDKIDKLFKIAEAPSREVELLEDYLDLDAMIEAVKLRKIKTEN